jgi:hypothetical protein
MNVTVHAAETSTDKLLDAHLPKLLRAAGDVSADWATWQSRPHRQEARGESSAQQRLHDRRETGGRSLGPTTRPDS